MNFIRRLLFDSNHLEKVFSACRYFLSLEARMHFRTGSGAHERVKAKGSPSATSSIQQVEKVFEERKTEPKRADLLSFLHVQHLGHKAKAIIMRIMANNLICCASASSKEFNEPREAFQDFLLKAKVL